MRAVRTILPAAPVAALLLAGTAHAETRVSALAGVDAGYASNPYLGTANDLSSASVSLSLAPQVTLTGPTSNVDLSGRVNHSVFARRYDDTTDWSLGAAARLKLTPRSNLSLGAGFSSQVNNGLNTTLQTPGLPDSETPLPDPSATELVGQRSDIWSGSAGFDTAISSRDTLNLSAAIYRMDYGPGTMSYSYSTYSGSAGMQHAFSEKLSAGASLSVSKTEYDQAVFGSSRQVSPTVDATVRLAPRTTLAVSVGASFTRVEAVNSFDTTNFYGRASLCHQGDRSRACVLASRSTGATAQSGNSTLTSVSGDYSYTLTPRSSIQLGAQYVKSKAIGPSAVTDTGHVSGSAGYQHQLSQRLSFTVNARYTNPFESAVARKASFYGGVGLTYRLGR